MAGCFGDDPEDKWKEGQSLAHYDIEEDCEDEKITCQWCSDEYLKEDSGAREPELYCSPACRCLHYQYSDEKE